MRKALAVAVILASAASAIAQTPRVKSLYRTFRFSETEIGIRCTNGADPTGRKIGDILVISCGDAK